MGRRRLRNKAMDGAEARRLSSDTCDAGAKHVRTTSSIHLAELGLKTLAPDATGNLGIWECQPGGWPVVNRPDTEFTCIVLDRARLTDEATGSAAEVTGGDLVILPPGWTGRWDVIETVRKVYAIY